MLFRPMAEPVPSAFQELALESLTALEGLTGYDQLEITCRQLVSILWAYRGTFAGSQERRGGSDLLCDALMEWLEAEIAPLRFAQIQ